MVEEEWKAELREVEGETVKAEKAAVVLNWKPWYQRQAEKEDWEVVLLGLKTEEHS